MGKTIAATRYISNDSQSIRTAVVAKEDRIFRPESKQLLPHLVQAHVGKENTYSAQTMPTSRTTPPTIDKEAPASPEVTPTAPVRTAHNAFNSSTLRSLFLALPSELRTAIYIASLDTSQDLAILYTCRQIYMEASPVLYQRPVHFSSQKKLFSWLERSRAQDLRRIRSLTLRLTDVDLAPLFDITPARRGNNISAWDLYQRELVCLDDALYSLQGLEHLVIVPPPKHKSTFVRSMYICFLGRVVVRCPRLKQLTLHDDSSLLQKVPELSKLAKVVFEGSSSIASSAAACIDDKLASKLKREETTIKLEIGEEERG